LTGPAECGTFLNFPARRRRMTFTSAVAAPVASRIGVALLASLLSTLPGPAAAAEADQVPDDCAVLAALDFSDAAGAPVRIDGELVAARADLPAHCRVSGRVAPEVGVEIWLPTKTWIGKLLVAGCYGLCGSIRGDQMEDALARGYATATTDGGHSDRKYSDSRWAFNDTALEDDFGHRAVHVTTLLAKALVGAFYGHREQYAYFRGCSTGGRQALVSAQRYPDDFDGIIAGAPFNQRLDVPFMIWVDRANTGADGQPILRKAQFELLQRAVLAQCDAADGLTDGVVGEVRSCNFRPASLACGPGETKDCLTPAQIEAAVKIYSGPANSAGQRFAPFGFAVGSEFTWEQQLLGREGKPSFFRSIGQNWMRFHAFEPDPPPGTAALEFDFDKDPQRLAAGDARVGFEPDLEAFARRDGKLILYHGWADENLQPAHTLVYWEDALRRNGGAAELGRFARLFLLPGVTHCGGGPGAGDVDYLTALERWVEKDEAPDVLMAWRTKDSVPVTVRQPRFPLTGEVTMKRPVFPYPAVARYLGRGDPLDPVSYEQLPRRRPPVSHAPPGAAR
jgi:feruloyl esterase